jgi:hypothetical protein
LNTRQNFIKGLDLNRGFYREVVKPILERSFPGLRYSASLLGYGSDVLGMDTTTSIDHNWGPRMQIFVDDKDIIPRLNEILGEELPFEYSGYSVNFSDPGYDKTRRMEKTGKKPIKYLIETDTPEDYFKNRYSLDKINNYSLSDWLRFKDQELLEITSGEVFHDGLEKLHALRTELAFYPPDIWKLRMAVLWHYIWNKEAFVGRAVSLNDYIGIKIITGRLVNYLIKILFYLEKKYIPYSKWFGSAFRSLKAFDKAGTLAEDILSENKLLKTEDKLCPLYSFIVERHNLTGGLPRLNNTIRDFFGRPYKVIFAETIVEKLTNSIVDEEIKSVDLGKYAYDIILDE